MNRKPWTLALAFGGLLCLILDSPAALEGARQGVELCMKTVVPSLFPFFVCSLLVTSQALEPVPRALGLAGRLFSLPRGSESILIPAFLGGYPAGAQCVAQTYAAGGLDRQDAERMLAYCSNAGPAFLFGMAGAFFQDRGTPWVLWAIHIAAAWMVSVLLPPSGRAMPAQNRQELTLTDAVARSVRTMGLVCGWVVLFRVVLRFLEKWALWLLPPAMQVLAAGLLELSNGCCALGEIPSEEVRFLLCGGMLGFGGLCVMMQTASVTKGLSIKYYAAGKVLHCLLSLLLCVLWCLHPILTVPSVLAFAVLRLQKRQKRCSIPEKAVV